MLLGIAMAIQTPTHIQCLGLIHFFHLVDATMTGFATDPTGNVGAVVKVDVVR